MFLSVLFLAAVSFAQGQQQQQPQQQAQQQQEQPYAFRALDPRQFEARVDLDMFVNQWSHEANVEEIWSATDGVTKPFQ